MRPMMDPTPPNPKRNTWHNKPSLWETHPELAAQLANPGNGWTVTAKSAKRVTWRCDEKHEWETRVADRTKGRGCPYCSGHKAIIGETDLATTHPALASQLVNPEVAATVSAGSNRKIAWRCEKGHEWEAQVSHRAKGQGCPYCASRRVIPGETDLATTHPALASQLVEPVTAVQVSAGSNKRVEWRCGEGHEWSATVASRALKNSGCPFCSGRRPIENLGTETR